MKFLEWLMGFMTGAGRWAWLFGIQTARGAWRGVSEAVCPPSPERQYVDEEVASAMQGNVAEAARQARTDLVLTAEDRAALRTPTRRRTKSVNQAMLTHQHRKIALQWTSSIMYGHCARPPLDTLPEAYRAMLLRLGDDRMRVAGLHRSLVAALDLRDRDGPWQPRPLFPGNARPVPVRN